MKKHIFIIDTSAILSGKSINLKDEKMLTTPEVSEELKPGGRDYQNFQFLLEMGLEIRSPLKKSIDFIRKKAEETGDLERLSSADIQILSLAVDINSNKDLEAVILSDDYSIQNVASNLNIKFQSISQRGILKEYKWQYRCVGCKKRFDTITKTCPICGAKTKLVRYQKK